MDRVFFGIGALLAGLGVMAGAFGSHALRARLAPDMLNVFEVAVRYQLIHALGLMAVAWASTRWPGAAVNAAGGLFIAGIVLFSGSLYLLTILGTRGLGIVTPIGGVLMAAGWASLAWAALSAR